MISIGKTGHRCIADTIQSAEFGLIRRNLMKRIIPQTGGRTFSTGSKPIVMEMQIGQRHSRLPECVKIFISDTAPIMKLNPQFERAFARLKEFVLIDPENSV